MDKMLKRTKKVIRRTSRKVSLYQGVKQLTTTHSVSRVSYGRRPLGTQAKIFANSTHGNWTSVVQDQIKSNIGKQEVGDVNILDDPDIGTIRAQVVQYQQSGFSSIQMNNIRFLLKSFKARYEFKNFATDTAYIDLYDCIARRDIGKDDNLSINVPSVAFAQGVKDQVVAFDINQYQRPGESPFNSRQFVTFYKVVKITRVILPPGGTHEHTVYGSPNYIYNWTQNIGTTGQVFGYKGLTTYTMYVARGSVALGSDGFPTYENCDIAVVGNKAVEYAFTNTAVNVTSNTFTLTSALSTANNYINPTTAELDVYSTLT